MKTTQRRTIGPGWQLLGCVLIAVGPGVVCAQAQPAGGGGAGLVNLPYNISDSRGTNWNFYQGGWFQQQGNRPTFGQAVMLSINNNGLQMRDNNAHMDAKTGELIFEGMNASGFEVKRRVAFDKDERIARYVDIISNPQAQEQTIELRLQTNVNYGVSSGEIVADPKRKNQSIAWVVQTHGGGAAAQVFAGRGSKVAPEIQWQMGNNQCQVIFRLTIPAKSDVAVMHLHNVVDTQEQGVDWSQSINSSKALAQLPREIRRLVVNFPGGQSFIGDYELLRGDTNSDIVELRGGDQLKGTLKPDSYTLEAFYGQVKLPAERVIAIQNVGEFRPRQLLVTIDGEIFGGYLAEQTVELQMSTGQITQIPIGQISRIGYRKRPNEPEEWKFEKPLVVLRSGDRMIVEPPAGPIEVMTRYGLLKLAPQAVAAVLFQSESLEQGIHEVRLTDGSRVAGLATSPQFELTLATSSGSSAQTVTINSGDMNRLQLATGDAEAEVHPAENAPTMELAGGDLLVGTLEGKLNLDTAFDTLALDAAGIRKLSGQVAGNARSSADQSFGTDVQVTLWDNSVVRGQLRESSVQCRLQSGPVLSVPVPLIVRYEHPEPEASAEVVERVKAVVTRLNADDWRERDRAQQELIEMGEPIIAILRDLRSEQPLEAQQRIDQILTKMGASTAEAAEPAASPAPANITIELE